MIASGSTTDRPGERRAVPRSNGVGKTTLFNCVTGDFLPTSGTIRQLGGDVTAFQSRERIRRGLRRTCRVSLPLGGHSVAANVSLACRRVSRGRFSLIRPRRGDVLVARVAEQIEAVHLTAARDTCAPILDIKGLNVRCGAPRALQGVVLRLNAGVLSMVGRSGTGKTPLRKATRGLVLAAAGMITFGGRVLNDKFPAEIARMGIGHVSYGRRLWRSLSVDEHLRMVATGGGHRSLDRVCPTFSGPAERGSNGGGQLSGGERQMSAIACAHLMNPHLRVMDEPTEGLAPLIVTQVEDMLVRLNDEGDTDVPVIERNIGVVCAVADNVAIMLDGRGNRTVPTRKPADDCAVPQRLPDVGRHGHENAVLKQARSVPGRHRLAPRLQ